jgi:hypothetical protein
MACYHGDRCWLGFTNLGHSVTSKYMWPFNEDLIRFDFETDNSILINQIIGKEITQVDSSAYGIMGRWLRGLRSWLY